MNELNYASLEASKKLVDNWIVLETEAVWRKKRDKTGYYLSRKALYHRTSDVPAPSMAEVWRELPEDTHIEKFHQGTVLSVICWVDDSPCFEGNNLRPTDVLIDLLIWVRKEKRSNGKAI